MGQESELTGTAPSEGQAQEKLSDGLLKRVSEGDVEALEALFRVLRKEIRDRTAVVKASLGANWRHEATTLVNELYVRLRELFERRQEKGEKPLPVKPTVKSFLSYIGVMVRNQILGEIRKEKQGTQILFGLDMEKALAGFDVSTRILMFEEQLEALEIKSRTWAAIVRLRYVLNMTIEETAQALNLTPNQVIFNHKKALDWLEREVRRALGDNESA